MSNNAQIYAAQIALDRHELGGYIWGKSRLSVSVSNKMRIQIYAAKENF